MGLLSFSRIFALSARVRNNALSALRKKIAQHRKKRRQGDEPLLTIDDFERRIRVSLRDNQLPEKIVATRSSAPIGIVKRRFDIVVELPRLFRGPGIRPLKNWHSVGP